MRHPKALSLGLLMAASAPLMAEVHLSHIVSDHAVLQREMPVHLWGTASPREKLSISFHDQQLTISADKDGNWEAWLKPEKAGGPFTLKLTGSDTPAPVTRTDILVGDVWIASGQSNMEFPLRGFTGAPLKDSEQEIANATQPQLRLFNQKRRTSTTVLDDTDDSWTLCTPETAKGFSAVAYFFGRELAAREHVPIGLIDITWGGTPAHSWISLDALATANLPSVAADAARIARDQGKADRIRTQYAVEDAAIRAAGNTPPTHPKIPEDHGGAWTPGTLYNGMVAPFTRYAIKGVIWYQGEADAGTERAPAYAKVFSTLIQDWRHQWNEGAFPFLFAQISSFGSKDAEWGYVRDNQRRVAQSLSQTAMVVTLDRGLAENIHPPDKQTVAARLALVARETVYGEHVESASPTFFTAAREGEAMRVWFDHAKGLTSSDKELHDFEVAGDDHKFLPATAILDGETMLIRAPGVTDPRYVRYAWKGTVASFFYNAAGLPGSTFTSEP